MCEVDGNLQACLPATTLRLNKLQALAKASDEKSAK